MSHRKHNRKNLDLYVNKIVGDEPHLAKVRDISASGIYLYKLLEPGQVQQQQVGLELKLPGHENVIWAVGQVVRDDARKDTDGVALRFIRIAETDRQAINDFVSARQAA